jgi:hypothetical protein
VVGARGERRIEKRLKETMEKGGGYRRGGGTEARGRRPGLLTGSNRTVLASRQTKDTVREQDTERDEDENSGMETAEESEMEREETEAEKRQKLTKRKGRSRGSCSDSPLEKHSIFSI